MTKPVSSRDAGRHLIGRDDAATESKTALTVGPEPNPTGRASLSESYLSPKAVATLLGVDKRTLRRWARNGRLVPRRLGPTVGSTLRYDPREVDAFLSGGSSEK
jgi:excisionase family DNA binding protein